MHCCDPRQDMPCVCLGADCWQAKRSSLLVSGPERASAAALPQRGTCSFVTARCNRQSRATLTPADGGENSAHRRCRRACTPWGSAASRWSRRRTATPCRPAVHGDCQRRDLRSCITTLLSVDGRRAGRRKWRFGACWGTLVRITGSLSRCRGKVLAHMQHCHRISCRKLSTSARVTAHAWCLPKGSACA